MQSYCLLVMRRWSTHLVFLSLFTLLLIASASRSEGSVQVAATLSPTSLTALGGPLTVNATINTGAVATSYAYAQLYEDGSAYVIDGEDCFVYLTNTSGDAWTGDFDIPVDSSTTVTHKWTAVVTAFDADGNMGTVTTAADTQGADTLPAISVKLTPTSIPVAGGTLNVTATVTGSASGIAYVCGTLYLNGKIYNPGYTVIVPLNNTSANTYTGSFSGQFFSLPPNPTTTAQSWTVVVDALDILGNTAFTTSAAETQPADTAPKIAANLSAVPVIGGTVNITATVAPGSAGVPEDPIYAQILEDGKPAPAFEEIPLYNSSGNTYLASFTAPANSSPTVSHSWSAVITVTDVLGVVTTATSTAAVQPADTPPTITLRLTPTSLTATGETLNVTATFSGGKTPMEGAAAQLFEDGKAVPNSVQGLGQDSSTVYATSYNIPNNTSTATHSWTVIVTSTDQAGGSTTVTSAADVQAADKAPAITTSLMPSKLPVDASTLTVQSTVVAGGSPVSQVIAQLVEDGTPVSGQTTGLYNTGSSDVYSGTFSIPGNATLVTHSWSVIVTVTDAVGVMTSAASTADVQAADTTPAIKITLSPASIPIVGGYVTVDATVSNSVAGISNVVGEVYEDGVACASFGMNINSTNSFYTGQFYVPQNTSETESHIWTVIVTVTDHVGNNTTATSLNDVQAADTAPAVSASISPSPIPAASPMVTVTGTFTGSGSGIQYVTAQFYENGSPTPYTEVFGLGQSSSTVFTTTYNLPSNSSTSATHTWTVVLTATDNVGNVFTTASPAVTQVMDSPAVISTIISPSPIPVQGATLTVTSTITDPSGIYTVAAEIYRDGVYYNCIYNFGPVSGNKYAGTVVVPVNDTTKTHTWTAIVTVVDNLFNSTSSANGGAVQLADTTAPIITGQTVTPTILPATGGSITVMATVTDTGSNNTGLTEVKADLYKNGTLVQSGLSLTSPSQNSVYTGTFYGIPANSGADYVRYTVVVNAYDVVGNVGSATAGPCLQETTVSQPIPTLTSITPATGYARGPVTMTLTGTNFGNRSVVHFGSSTVYPTMISATQLVAIVPANALPQPGSVSVTVVNLAPGGGTSAGQTFTIIPGLSTLVISPTSVVAGKTVTGTVTLTAAATTAETVTVTSSDPANAPISNNGMVAIAQGATSGMFTIAVPAAAPAESLTITAAAGFTSSQKLTITAAPASPKK